MSTFVVKQPKSALRASEILSATKDLPRRKCCPRASEGQIKLKELLRELSNLIDKYKEKL